MDLMPGICENVAFPQGITAVTVSQLQIALQYIYYLDVPMIMDRILVYGQNIYADGKIVLICGGFK